MHQASLLSQRAEAEQAAALRRQLEAEQARRGRLHAALAVEQEASATLRMQLARVRGAVVSTSDAPNSAPHHLLRARGRSGDASARAGALLDAARMEELESRGSGSRDVERLASARPRTLNAGDDAVTLVR